MFHFTMDVMKLAPIGIFATIAFRVGRFGSVMLIPLGKLILSLFAVFVIFILVVLVGTSIVCKVNFFHLVRTIKETLLLAFTTASSETALPLLVKRL